MDLHPTYTLHESGLDLCQLERVQVHMQMQSGDAKQLSVKSVPGCQTRKWKGMGGDLGREGASVRMIHA